MFIIVHDLVELLDICIIIIGILQSLTISWLKRDDDFFTFSFNL